MTSSHEIRFTSKWTGKQEVHPHSGSDYTASGWAESLAREHGCKTEAVRNNSDGTQTHIVSYGDKK